MKMNKKAVSPVIAVMLLVAVAVAAVGAYFIWYKSFQAGSQKNVEEQTGTIGSKLRVTNITNDNVTFYITIKNATGKALVILGGVTDPLTQSEVQITIKDAQGNPLGGGTLTVDVAATGNYASFTTAAGVPNDEEGQIEFHIDTDIQPGQTYTIIITAAGTTSTEKYTAI
jgi:flagellin-like protein